MCKICELKKENLPLPRLNNYLLKIKCSYCGKKITKRGLAHHITYAQAFEYYLVNFRKEQNMEVQDNEILHLHTTPA